QTASAGEHLHARTNGVAIRGGSRALHEQPVVLRAEVLQQARPRTDVGDDDFERAVVVEIAGGRPARRLRLPDAGAGRRRQILEPAAAYVPVEEPRLPVVDLGPPLDLRIHMAVDEQQAAPAVVNEGAKLPAPDDSTPVSA